MCTVLLPPGVNPIAVDKYIYSYIKYYFNKQKIVTGFSMCHFRATDGVRCCY